MKMIKRLWNDEAGFVISSELVLVATVLVIGMLVGIVTVRDQVVQELGDVATAIGQVNESYTFNGVTGHTSATAGSSYTDETDYCNPAASDVPGFGSACIALSTQAPTPESDLTLVAVP